MTKKNNAQNMQKEIERLLAENARLAAELEEANRKVQFYKEDAQYQREKRWQELTALNEQLVDLSAKEREESYELFSLKLQLKNAENK